MPGGTTHPRGQARAALCLLTAVFFLRGLFLNLALPYGDPLDEPFHYAYAAYVAETGRIPGSQTLSLSPEVLRPRMWMPRSALPGPRVPWRDFASLTDQRKTEHRREAFRYIPAERQEFATANYEVQQPPFAYVIAAALLKTWERGPLDGRLLLLRISWSAIASAAVWLAFGFFRRLFSEPAALAATLAWVTFPGLGSFIGRFSNDALALVIATALLGIWVDISQDRLSRRKAVWLAVLLALGCWTKLYMLLLVAVAPLAALFARSSERVAIRRRSLAACVAALVAFSPWLIHQRAETGDWLGLTPSKQATELGLGLQDRSSGAVERLTQPRFWIVLVRTFLWPGTWSAMGAPAVLAGLLVAVFLAIALGAKPDGARPPPSSRRSWAAVSLAVALFGIGQLLYAGTFAAIARSRGHSPSAGPDGWYLLILLPVFWTAALGLKRIVPAGRFVAAAGVFLLCEWRMTLGVLPGVYRGSLLPNGANAPLRDYAGLLLSPASALDVFQSVGLMPGAGMTAAFLGWLACLVAASLLTISQLRRSRRERPAEEAAAG
jgi:hypothetical protein